MGAIDDVIDKAVAAMRPLLEEAYRSGYDAGLTAGRAEGEANIRAWLTDLLESISEAAEPETRRRTVVEPDEVDRVEAAANAARAAPGTVKPAIFRAISRSPNGLTRAEIQKQTDVKPNSVRGTLWALEKEHAITRGENGRWVAVVRPGGNPIHEEPTGSESKEPPEGGSHTDEAATSSHHGTADR